MFDWYKIKDNFHDTNKIKCENICIFCQVKLGTIQDIGLIYTNCMLFEILIQMLAFKINILLLYELKKDEYFAKKLRFIVPVSLINHYESRISFVYFPMYSVYNEEMFLFLENNFPNTGINNIVSATIEIRMISC